MALVKQAKASGLLAEYFDHVEAEAKAFGLRPILTDDRARLVLLHRGMPPFPGWFPHGDGGAPGFWIDWQDREGNSRATGGAVFYSTAPASLGAFVNAGGMDAGGHVIRLAGEALSVAERISGLVAFSGNLIVWRQADRDTELSRWLTRVVPLLNKAVALTEHDDPAAFVTFVRDGQVAHLAPRYRLPVLVPGVSWSRRYAEDVTAHLGVQSRADLVDAIADVVERKSVAA